MKNLVEKTNENSSYSKWLKKLVGERKLFKELTEDEIYKIILRVSEIAYARNPILNQDHDYEEAAMIIYSDFYSRDYEKNLEILSEIKSDDFQYYDEKSGKYFKEWKRREEVKGFERWRNQGLTIEHFSNLMFRELRNHIAWYTRKTSFKNMYNNTISLDMFRDDNSKKEFMKEKISDGKDYFEEVNTDINASTLFTENESINGHYFIKINEDTRILSYDNLLYLYGYLADGKKVTVNKILEHIIYKNKDESEELTSDCKKYIYNYISSFKKKLLENSSILCSTYIDRKGKERKCYGFAE